MTRPRARNGKDEATGFHDRGSDATIAHGDQREAVRARKHVRDTDSARRDTTRAVSAFLFATAKHCRCGTHTMSRMKPYASMTTIVAPLVYVGRALKPDVPTSAVARLPAHAMAIPNYAHPQVRPCVCQRSNDEEAARARKG